MPRTNRNTLKGIQFGFPLGRIHSQGSFQSRRYIWRQSWKDRYDIHPSRSSCQSRSRKASYPFPAGHKTKCGNRPSKTTQSPVRKDDPMPRNPIIYLLQLLTHIIRQYGIFPIQSRTNPFGRKTHIIVRLIFSSKDKRYKKSSDIRSCPLKNGSPFPAPSKPTT